MKRRLVLGTFIAALAILSVLGSGRGAGAQNNSTFVDWGSKADFKEFCDLIGGGFIDSPGDNMTICVYPNGDREVCDQNGGDCVVFPKSSAPSGQDNFGGFGRITSTSAGTVLVNETPPTKIVVVKSGVSRVPSSRILDEDE